MYVLTITSQEMGIDRWKSNQFLNFDDMIDKRAGLYHWTKAQNLNKQDVSSRRMWETPLKQTSQMIKYSSMQFRNWTESCEKFKPYYQIQIQSKSG